MPTAVVDLIGGHDRRPPEQRVKRICDLHLARQTTGIMRPYRTLADSAPPPSIRWSRPPSLTAMIRKSIALMCARINDHPAKRITELMPWNCSHPAPSPLRPQLSRFPGPAAAFAR